MKGMDRPAQLQNVGIDQKLDAKLPLDTQFRDEAGRDVRLGDYFGKRPVVLALAYYDCPMLCTQVLNGMVRALKVLTFTPGRNMTWWCSASIRARSRRLPLKRRQCM